MSLKILEFIKEIKGMIPKKQELSDLVFGEVISISPLAIKIDAQLTVDEEFLILSAFVKETIIKIPVNHNYQHDHVIPAHTTEPAGEGPHTHAIRPWRTEMALPEIMLWRGLKIGDKVRLLRSFSGQRYYILERQEGITNDPE